MDRKNGIDVFRFIGAFFIMCLHTGYGSLSQEYSDGIRLVSRWALPFYFMTTGYFLASKIVNKSLDFKRVEGNVSRLITIFIISSFIFLPLGVLKGYAENSIDAVLIGSYFHLWFVGSLVIGYVFIWYLFYTKRSILLSFISMILILLALLTDSYDQFFGYSLSYELFRFLLVIPFMYIGVLVYKNRNKVVNHTFLIGLILLGLIVQFVEAEVFYSLFAYAKTTHQFLIGSLITAVAVFVLSVNLELKETRLSLWGRQYSLFIYLYHPLIFMVSWRTLDILAPDQYGTIKMFSPIIGFILTLLCCLLLRRFFPKIFNFMNGEI